MRKRILLIGINFGDYEVKIKEEFEKKGYDVFYFFDTVKNYNLYMRIFPSSFVEYLTFSHQKGILKKIEDIPFEQIIVIVGRQLKLFFLKALREKYPKARFTLYLWDDVKRVENFDSTKKYYDCIYSFDPIDCKNHGFKHLPLFYTETDANSVRDKELDLYTAMFSHSDREELLGKIAAQCREKGLTNRFYVCQGRYGYVKTLLFKENEYKQKKENGFVFISKAIDIKNNYDLTKKSKAVMDIPFAGQNGLTMRTIETLGLKTKLITTNKNITEYDFFRPDNVFVVDRENPVMDIAFFDKEYKPLDDDIYQKYSLRSWTDMILGNVDYKYLANK